VKRSEARAILAEHGITNRFSLRTVTIWDRTRQVLTIKQWDPDEQEVPDDLRSTLESQRVSLDFEPVPGYTMATETTMHGTRHYFGKTGEV